MLKPNILQRRLLLLFWFGIMTVGSLLPSRNIPRIQFDIIAPDKIAHVLLYAGFAFLLGASYRRLSAGYVWGISAGIGIAFECLQPLLSARQFEVYDMLANAVGAAIGLIVLNLIIKQAKM